MSDPTANPLDRLDRAVRVFLAHRADGRRGDQELLDTHPELADLLEPLLQDADDTPPDPGSADHAQVLGDFALRREIGRGGMGVVYEADQLSLRRRVAVKVLSPGDSNVPRRVARFLREAAAAARLRHPGIVPIHAVGQCDGQHYFAMTYIQGETLRARAEAVRSGQRQDYGVAPDLRPVAEAAEIVARIAEALDYAHQHRVVHRDVKPQNILIGDDGSVHLVDFGLAVELDLEAVSRSGDFAGTLQYASPEQVRGGAIGPSSDLYSLGAVLYELLAGERPHRAASPQELMAAIAEREPVPVRRHNARVPRDLETICHRALGQTPGERYPSAGDLAADLRRFLQHEPIVAAPPSLPSRVLRVVRRRRQPLTIAALAVVAGLAIVTWRVEATRRASSGAAEQQRALDALQSAQSAWALAGPPTWLATRPDYLAQTERVAAHYEDILRTRDDVTTRFEAARAIARWAAALDGSGRTRQALAAHDRGIALLQALRAEYPDVAVVAHALAAARRDRAMSPAADPDTGDADFAAAIAAWDTLLENAPAERAIALRSAIASSLSARAEARFDAWAGDAELQDLLRRADAAWQEVPDEQRQRQALTHRMWSLLHRRRGDHHAAVEAARAGVALCRSGGGVEVDLWRAACQGQLGIALRSNGDEAQALSELRLAVDQERQLQANGIDGPAARQRRARLHWHLGGALWNLGEQQQAWQQFSAAKIEFAIEHRPTAADSVASRRCAADIEASRVQVLVDAPQLVDEDARGLVDAALAAHDVLLAREPVAAADRSRVGATLHNVALWRMLQGDVDRAVDELDRAVTQQSLALEAEPDQPRYRTLLANHFRALLPQLRNGDDHARLVATARDYHRHFAASARELATAVECCARAVAAALADRTLADTERQRAADGYAEQAVAWLREMLDRGWVRPDGLQDAAVFAPLRARPPMRILLDEIAR